jgi:hypothetical protein
MLMLASIALLITVGAVPATGGDNGPKNPAAAKREIIRAFESWGAVSTIEDAEANFGLIDDSRGVVDAARQAQQNFPYEVSHDKYRVTEVRFTSPTAADVTYDILVLPSGPNFTERVGHAVLGDGHWKLTRGTVCADLALAGGSCDGGKTVIHVDCAPGFHYPPGREGEVCVPDESGPPPAPPAPPTRGTPRFTG